MKYTIYCDTHIGSPIQIMNDLLLKEPAHVDTLFLGDIFDLANASKKDLPGLVYQYNQFKKTHGSNYIDGNHERVSTRNDIIVRGRTVFAHGDFEANPTRWLKYRKKHQGAGVFKRKFIIPFIREAEEVIERSPNHEFLDRAASLAKSINCDKYVCGHFHPSKLITIYHKGVYVYILPRGITELYL